MLYLFATKKIVTVYVGTYCCTAVHNSRTFIIKNKTNALKQYGPRCSNRYPCERLQKIIQSNFFKFCVVGGLMFCLDAAILYGCMYGLNFSPSFARVISAICSITISWRLHRSYTFNSSNYKLLLEYRNYIICSLLSFIINLSAYIILIKKLLIFWEYPILALILATAASMNFSYFFMKKVVFK